MSRPLRISYPKALLHVTCRGNNGQQIFLDQDDYYKYLSLLAQAKKKYSFKFYAYALMPNHVHLLIELSSTSVSKIIQSVNTGFAAYFNNKYERSGHLFQGRFFSAIVQKKNYLLEVTRYIHLNPVRSELVSKPEEYIYSSYKHYIHSNNGLIDVDEVFSLMGLMGSNAQRQYVQFVAEGIYKKEKLNFVVKKGQWYLGSPRFIYELAKKKL